MSSPENMLVIMSDEHQARALSCLGHFVDTPNLDRLAAEGRDIKVVWMKAHCTKEQAIKRGYSEEWWAKNDRADQKAKEGA